MSKKIITFLFLVLSCYSITAQTIRNPSFDSVYIGGIDRMIDWIPSTASPFSYIIDTLVYANEPDTCYAWLDPYLFDPVGLIYNGAYVEYGIKLTTTSLVKENGQPFETFLVNGGKSYKTGSDGYIDFAKVGEPFPYRPSAMNGWYKFFDTIPQTQDYGRCMVLLKKWNAALNQSDTIATGEASLGVASDWTAFQVPLNYQSSAVPDSIVVLFLASSNPLEYGELWLDELSFDFTSALVSLPKSDDFPTVYPNPNSGIINIKGGKRYTDYQIISLDGRQLKGGEFSRQINVAAIHQKTFILLLFDKEEMVKALRIVKQ